MKLTRWFFILFLTYGREIKGKLVSVRDSSVYIAVEDEDVPAGLSTATKGILGIRDSMISRFVVEGSSHVLAGMGLGLLGGLAVGGGIGAAAAGAETGSWKGMNQPMDLAAGCILGAVGGMLMGAAIGAGVSESDIEVDLSVPAERSALKKLAGFPDKEPEFLQRVK